MISKELNLGDGEVVPDTVVGLPGDGRMGSGNASGDVKSRIHDAMQNGSPADRVDLIVDLARQGVLPTGMGPDQVRQLVHADQQGPQNLAVAGQAIHDFFRQVIGSNPDLAKILLEEGENPEGRAYQLAQAQIRYLLDTLLRLSMQTQRRTA
jgi:hypothetical protein